MLYDVEKFPILPEYVLCYWFSSENTLYKAFQEVIFGVTNIV